MKKVALLSSRLVLMLAIYLAGYAAVYFSVVIFFGLSQGLTEKCLAAALIFSAVSFFLSTWFSHIDDNDATRAYYFVSGLCLGFLFNLLLFFGLVWLAIALSPWLHISFDQKIAAIFAICFSLAYSAYGVWNNFTPRVTRIDVKIKNLPAIWIGRKIVQISDVHLGHVFGVRYMRNVAAKINALKPDMIVITGDLFDGTDGRLDAFAKPLDILDAPLGVYFVDGNHETYLGTEKSFSVISKTKIVPLRDSMRVIDGLQLIGIDYPERMESKNLEQAIKSIPDFNRERPSILLWHTPTQTQEAKNAGISLQLSGHTHKGQLFPLGLITWLVYKGNDYGLRSDGSFSLYTSSGLGLWGPPMRTQKISEIVEITLR